MELDRDLSTTSDIYRKEKSDRKITTLKMTVNGLIKQTYAQLGNLIPDNEKERAELHTLIKGGCSYIAQQTFIAAQARYPENIKGTNYWAFSVVVDEGEKTDFGSKNIFQTVKDLYTPAKNDFVIALDDFFQKRNKSTNFSGQQFFNLEHLEGSSVAEQQISEAQKKFMRRGASFNERNAETGSEITQQDLKELGLDLFINKTGTLEKDTLVVGLGSRVLNAAKAGGERALKQYYIDTIREALIRLDSSENFADRPGSDSRNTIIEKKVKKRVKKKLNRNIKNTIKDEPINLSKGSAKVTHKRKTKVKKAEVSLGSIKVSSKGRSKKPAYSSFISLQTLINAKLPTQVKKNMIPPALQNRSGRFAESARVTDIQQTKRGYPSIGFTYQRNPYQIFEQGSGKTPWANENRDPRKIIDKSIREIALELIEGRFYTRRV